MNEEITILHTNDLHSHFENWPKIRRFMKSESLNKTSETSQVIRVDLGDALDRAHPLTEATNGKANVELLDKINYDAVTIGNNEGLTNSHEQLEDLYSDANFDIVLANILEAKTQSLPKWAKLGKIIVTKNNSRILLIGLTAPYQLTYPILGWTPIEPEKVIPKLLNYFKGQYDVVVLLSHLGIDVDRRLAKQFPKLDVIIGSHTHHLLRKGEIVNGVLLAAAEKWGHYVGKITINVDSSHKVISKSAKVFLTKDLPEKPKDEEEIQGYLDRGRRMLSRNKIARIPVKMNHALRGNSRLISEGLKAIMEKANTSAAILNTGLFLTDLPAGVVDRNELHEMLPHSMHVMRVTLDGYNLWRMIREMEKNHNFLIKFPQKGMGFRGKYFGELHYNGLIYDHHSGRLYFHEDLVLPTESYEIAMPDHYLFIPFFPTIEIVGKNKILYDENLREVFGDYLAKHYPLK